MKRVLVVALAMVCLAMGCRVVKAMDTGVNGKWHFVFDTPDGSREVDAELTVDADGQVSGKFGKFDMAGTYKDGKLELNFPITLEDTGDTGPLKLVGKLDDTSALAGNWEFATYSGTFKATRPVAKPQDLRLNGKWHFVMDTPGGDREMDAEFAVDADGKVTGKFGKADVTGTYKDGKLDLSFQTTAEETGETASLKLVGKMDDTLVLTGTWEFSAFSGTFRAARPDKSPKT